MILSRESGERNHAVFRDIGRYLRPRSLLVLNDTRVIPARLHGRKPSGGQVEVLLVERLIAPPSAAGAPWREDWAALARSLGASPVGTVLRFDGGLEAEILARGERGNVQLRFRGPGDGLLCHVEQVGSIPLPPYIEAARKLVGMTGSELAADDKIRYQTVYAREPGAVAAPTAGLHFTEHLLAELQEAGHEVARITLHVGPGTFRPVTADDPREHRMDSERYHVSESAAQAIRCAQEQGRPVVAVGTTVVRTLETLARAGEIRAGSGSTRLYILPGESFRVVTDLITNFHLPRSSLLMLVAAFAGHSSVLQAYAEAVRNGYRFYSYGDAMFIRAGRVIA
jgi:S-adenosylmethionine:tRNA ribosyltransferase-isomerase